MKKIVLTLAFVVLVAGCVSGVAPVATTGNLVMKITDAPGNITSLEVTISQIEIHIAETTPTEPETCEEQCQALGYGVGICRTGPDNETLCLENELDIGNTTDCPAEVGEGELGVDTAPSFRNENETSTCCCDTNTTAPEIQTGWIVFSDEEQTFDLILIEDVNDILGEKELEAGKYTQIRLLVTSAIATIDGEEKTLKVPSGKLKLIHPFTIEANKTTSLILDFDAEKSVVERGNSGSYNLKPTIKIETEFTGKENQEANQIKEQQRTEAEERVRERTG
jgi:hypothetical protein